MDKSRNKGKVGWSRRGPPAAKGRGQEAVERSQGAGPAMALSRAVGGRCCGSWEGLGGVVLDPGG